MTNKPKWNSFEAARRTAMIIVGDHSDDPNMLIEKIAEALSNAWDDGALNTKDLYQKPRFRRKLLIELLRDHGIGIMSLEDLKAQTLAVARGELKLPPDEPKLSFSSIEAMVACLKSRHEVDRSDESH